MVSKRQIINKQYQGIRHIIIMSKGLHMKYQGILMTKPYKSLDWTGTFASKSTQQLLHHGLSLFQYFSLPKRLLCQIHQLNYAYTALFRH